MIKAVGIDRSAVILSKTCLRHQVQEILRAPSNLVCVLLDENSKCFCIKYLSRQLKNKSLPCTRAKNQIMFYASNYQLKFTVSNGLSGSFVHGFWDLMLSADFVATQYLQQFTCLKLTGTVYIGVRIWVQGMSGRVEKQKRTKEDRFASALCRVARVAADSSV